MSSERRRFRNSQLRMLRSCRWAYAEEYLRGTLGSPSPALQGGANVHHAIQLAVKEVVKGGAFLDVHQLAYLAVQGGNVLYADAVEVLTRFTESLVEEDVVIDRKGAFIVEEELEMPLQLLSGEEVIFFGTPDLVERTGRKSCRITDWKTHRHPESEEEFRADPQLQRYALLVNHHFPDFETFELTKRFVRFRNNTRTTTISRDDLERIRWELISEIAAAREIEDEGRFDPAGGDWCGLCAFHHTCPLIAKYREAGSDLLSIPNDERASEIAQAAIALDAAASALKSRLKVYLGDQHNTGKVPVSGGEYGYGIMTSRSATVAKLRDAFQAGGVEMPEDVLAVDLDQLDRVMKRLPETTKATISRAIVTTESSQCRFRRGRAPKPVAGGAASLDPNDDLF